MNSECGCFPEWYPEKPGIRAFGVFSVSDFLCLSIYVFIRHLPISFFDDFGVF